jgi:hypothetical protein
MNSTKTGMRTVLAAAAAGALLLGSAGGAMAHPTKSDKTHGPAGYIQLRMADVHNGFINVNPNAKHRDLKVKANVRDTDKINNPDGVKLTLAQFDMKGGTAVVDPMVANQVIELTTKSKAGKKSLNYRGVLKGDDLVKALTDGATLKLLPGQTILLCLAEAEVTAPVEVKAPKRQVTKKLGRDCVRVVNVDPTTTTSHSDDTD